MLVSSMVTFTTSDSEAPAAASTLVRLVKVCTVWPSIVVLVKLSYEPTYVQQWNDESRTAVMFSTQASQVGAECVCLTDVSSPMEPLAKTRLPDTTACEYAAMLPGAFGVDIYCKWLLLDDMAEVRIRKEDDRKKRRIGSERDGLQRESASRR